MASPNSEMKISFDREGIAALKRLTKAIEKSNQIQIQTTIEVMKRFSEAIEKANDEKERKLCDDQRRDVYIRISCFSTYLESQRSRVECRHGIHKMGGSEKASSGIEKIGRVKWQQLIAGELKNTSGTLMKLRHTRSRCATETSRRSNHGLQAALYLQV